MSKEREALFEQIKAFYDKQGGFPTEWVEEINDIREGDSFDALDVVVGKLCADWGDVRAVRDFLYSMGGEEDLVDELLADSFDMFF